MRYQRLLRAAATSFIVTLLLDSTARSADWPIFRGPNVSGISESHNVPTKFSPETNVVWKTNLPAGKSSPVLTVQRIYLTAHHGGELITLCVDRKSGEILWQSKISQPREERLHRLNSPASSTPATDGKNVYAFFGDFGLVSYDADGVERWRIPLGPFTNLHGMSASPIIVDDKVIVVCDQDNDSFLLAVHKDTGQVVWETKRPEVVHGFSTPSIYRPGEGPPQVIVPGSYQIISYDAATGKKLWWVRGITWQMKPAAVVAGDTIYVTGWAPGAEPSQRRFFPSFEEVARQADANHNEKISPEELPEKWKPTGSWRAIDLDRDGFLDVRDWSFYRARRASRNVTLAIRPGKARGDLTDTHVLWDYERSVPEVPTPLLYQGLLYTIKDGGILTAIDAETGAIAKIGRLTGAIDKYYASPIAADGKIYLASETGKVAVVEPGRDWRVLTVNDLGEPVYATPAVADSCMYVRTETMLYAFAQQE